MPSASTSCLALLLAALLTACARGAPPLPVAAPPQTPAFPVRPADWQARCAAAAAAITSKRDEMAGLDARLARHRIRDQAAGLASAITLTPLPLALAGDRDTRRALDRLQAEVDVELAREASLGCPSRSNDPDPATARPTDPAPPSATR